MNLAAPEDKLTIEVFSAATLMIFIKLVFSLKINLKLHI